MWHSLKIWLDCNYFVIDILALITCILNLSVVGCFISVNCKPLLKMAKEQAQGWIPDKDALINLEMLKKNRPDYQLANNKNIS